MTVACVARVCCRVLVETDLALRLEQPRIREAETKIGLDRRRVGNQRRRTLRGEEKERHKGRDTRGKSMRCEKRIERQKAETRIKLYTSGGWQNTTPVGRA